MNSAMQRKWQRLADAQGKSGLSVNAFCTKRRICSTHFYARRKELRILRQDKPQSGFIRLTAGNSFSDHNKSMLPVQKIRPPLIVHRDPLPVRIQTPNGYSVEAVLANDSELAKVFGLLKSL